MTKKKTEINIETREVWTIRHLQPAQQSWCFLCDAQVELITPEQASFITGFGLRQIFRQIEQAQVHFLESPTGGVLICLSSLLSQDSPEKD